VEERQAAGVAKALLDGSESAQEADGLERLGKRHEAQGALDLAEDCWLRALTLDPNHAAAMLDLGRLALSLRQLDEAIARLERAAELSPDSIDPVYNLSRAYRLKGNLERAKQLDDRASKLRESEPPRGGMGS
jgi:tetratricopeptide (TPR) repeat protein